MQHEVTGFPPLLALITPQTLHALAVILEMIVVGVFELRNLAFELKACAVSEKACLSDWAVTGWLVICSSPILV